MRVHELAKELGLSSKTVMDMLAAIKVTVKSHSSSLDEVTVERIRRQAKGKAQPAPAAPAAPARVAKTPTGERILGMRKIVPPPAPLAEEVPAEKAEPTEPRPVAPAAAAPLVGAPPVSEPRAAPSPESKKPAVPAKPAVRPTTPSAAPARPAAKAVPAPPPTAPKGPPKETRPSPPRGGPATRGAPAPGRPQIRPAPPRREMPRHAPAAGMPGVAVPAAPPTGLPPLAPPPGPYAPPRERKTRERIPPPPPLEPAAPMVVPAEIDLSGPPTVGELAAKLEIPAGEVVKKLLEVGVLAGINQQIPLEVATKAVQALGSSVRAPSGTAVPAATRKRLEIAKDAAAPLRPPVVTIMGHVDHGKTSLLDAIRQTHVADREVGGITQHIGASTVETDGRRIVFIDTPGHEAFTTLRARGAQVTDIAILVVAADDGVMPQTIEAMNHAKAAGVPIIVAVNKIDLPQANPDRVKQQLAEQGLTPEDWGGDTVTVPVSARTKQGVKELLEMILLVAELQELRADPARPARGTVVEASLDKGRGPVATVLVQEGTLRVGDAIVAGEAFGRVRAMANDRGDRVGEATPATPVEVVGLSTVPVAGDLLEVVRDDRFAKAVAEERIERRKAAESATARAAAEEIYAHAEGPKELRLILKADTHGSVEALSAAIARLGTPEVGVTVLHEAVGNVTESDVMLAAASRAVIVGFNVRPDAQVRKLAEQEQIEILSYRIIYEAIDDLKARTRGLLAPKRREVSLGQAEVRQTFAISRVGTIAGCYVTNGVINRGATIRVIRDGVVVHEGKISSLRRFKDDVREVTEGFECGIALERFNDIKEGDILEAFEVREEPA